MPWYFVLFDCVLSYRVLLYRGPSGTACVTHLELHSNWLCSPIPAYLPPCNAGTSEMLHPHWHQALSTLFFRVPMTEHNAAGVRDHQTQCACCCRAFHPHHLHLMQPQLPPPPPLRSRPQLPPPLSPLPNRSLSKAPSRRSRSNSHQRRRTLQMISQSPSQLWTRTAPLSNPTDAPQHLPLRYHLAATFLYLWLGVMYFVYASKGVWPVNLPAFCLS